MSPVPRNTDAGSPASASAEILRDLRITQESVDAAPIGIFRLDSEGRVVSVNAAACQSLGYSEEELKTLTVFDFDPSFTREGWRAHRAKMQRLPARTLTSIHRRKDGSTFPVEVSVRHFFFENEEFSVSFVKDISERLRAEDERRKLEERMLRAQKLESLGVLAGGIAHDFNNLLMVIIGNLDLALVGKNVDGNEHLMLEDAAKAARQAADLCRQLLTYAGKGTSRTEPVDLGALLRDQSKILEVSASRSIRLMLNLADNLPVINADVSQLRQVFMNLIINASDAIGQAPGVITLSTSVLTCDRNYLEAVDIKERLEPGRYVCVEVADTGCGMDEAVRSRIFDPFFSTKTSSRGLGLAAVRGIMSKHRGGIRVYSEPGKGTTFRLLFPVASVPHHESTPAPSSGKWHGSGLVLLVDDEPMLLSVGVRMLRHLGFETLTAATGLQALETFKEHRDEIRIVVLDWTMPEMDGAETLAQLRRLDPAVPVIIVSGYAPDDLQRRLSGRHVTAIVRKPYNFDEIAAALQTASNETI
jgi:two-component system cell cycle sensor histidine kinase/response regulator CckA